MNLSKLIKFFSLTPTPESNENANFLTFSQLGEHGNLGNQLFQIASTIGLAKRNKFKYGFSQWKYSDYFENQLPEVPEITFIKKREQRFEYHDWKLKRRNYDIFGYLQCEKYFNIKLTKKKITFRQDLIAEIRNIYSKAFSKPTILISIRRGDFVHSPVFYQLSITYYMDALILHFKNWEDYNLIVLSDNIDYCKRHFSFLPNAFFGDGLTDIEQLCLGSLCDHFIISNSTFSWWSAWLGESSNSKVIRPLKYFIGKYAKGNNDKDYFPERWLIFDDNKSNTLIDASVFFCVLNFNSKLIENYFNRFVKLRSCNSCQEDLTELNSKISIVVKSTNFAIPPYLLYYLTLQLKKTSLSKKKIGFITQFKSSRKLELIRFGKYRSLPKNLESECFIYLVGFEKINIDNKDYSLKSNDYPDYLLEF